MVAGKLDCLPYYTYDIADAIIEYAGKNGGKGLKKHPEGSVFDCAGRKRHRILEETNREGKWGPGGFLRRPGESAEWIGSIAWDGYPDEIPDSIKNAKEESIYRNRWRVSGPAGRCNGFRTGLAVAWENSRGTDYAYAFDGGVVYGSKFGGGGSTLRSRAGKPWEAKTSVFPDMTKVQNPPRETIRDHGIFFLSIPQVMPAISGAL